MYKLLKIGSEACTPCKVLDEDFHQVFEQFPDLLVEKKFIDDEIKNEYSITKIPLLILFKNNIEIERLQTGDILKVLDWLDSLLNEFNDSDIYSI